MFRLSDCYEYGASLEEIIQKAREIKADADPALVEKALRHGIARYNELEHSGNLMNCPKQAISETCRGCDILIEADNSARIRSSFLCRYFAWILRWYAKINSALPLSAVFLLQYLVSYQSSIFTLVTSICDNGYYSAKKDAIGCSPYFIVLAAQAGLVSYFTSWLIGSVYAVSVIASGLGTLRLNALTHDGVDVDGWEERLRTEDIQRVLAFYRSEAAAN